MSLNQRKKQYLRRCLREMPKHLGAKLRASRKALGLKQADMAWILGMDQPTFARIELGKRKVSFVEVEVLARLYGKEGPGFFETLSKIEGLHQRLFVDRKLIDAARRRSVKSQRGTR